MGGVAHNISCLQSISGSRDGIAYLGPRGSVVEPEPELHGARTFGRSLSWSQNGEVSAPAPGSSSGSAKVVDKNQNSFCIESSM